MLVRPTLRRAYRTVQTSTGSGETRMRLSPRQLEVARLVVEGHSAKRIASMLRTFDPATGETRPLSTRTVEDYINTIAARIGGPSTGVTGSNRVRITRWWFTSREAPAEP